MVAGNESLRLQHKTKRIGYGRALVVIHLGDGLKIFMCICYCPEYMDMAWIGVLCSLDDDKGFVNMEAVGYGMI
jgi:hypothetical protein